MSSSPVPRLLPGNYANKGTLDAELFAGQTSQFPTERASLGNRKRSMTLKKQVIIPLLTPNQ